MVSKKLEDVVKVRNLLTGTISYISVSEFENCDYLLYEKLEVYST